MHALSVEMNRLRTTIAHAGSAGPDCGTTVEAAITTSKTLNLPLLVGIESALALVHALKAAYGGGSSSEVRLAVERVVAAREGVELDLEMSAHAWVKALDPEHRREIKRSLKTRFKVKSLPDAVIYSIRALFPTGSPSDEGAVKKARRCHLAASIQEMIVASLRAAAAFLRDDPRTLAWLRLSLKALDESSTVEAVRALREQIEVPIARAVRARSKTWTRIAVTTESVGRKLRKKGRQFLGVLAEVGGICCRFLGSAISVIRAYVCSPTQSGMSYS